MLYVHTQPSCHCLLYARGGLPKSKSKRTFNANTRQRTAHILYIDASWPSALGGDLFLIACAKIHWWNGFSCVIHKNNENTEKIWTARRQWQRHTTHTHTHRIATQRDIWPAEQTAMSSATIIQPFVQEVARWPVHGNNCRPLRREEPKSIEVKLVFNVFFLAYLKKRKNGCT